jgi:tetratricopeptide (TPR) repeat protein
MTETNQARALRLWEEGQRFHEGNQIERAIECYRESIAVRPTAEAHTFLGWALSFRGKLDEAIEECHRAIEIDPDFGNPYNDIGAYLVEKGEHEAAISWFERAKHALRYEPRHFPCLNLGRVYRKLGRVSLAILEFEEALAIHPGDRLATESLRQLRQLN